MSQQSGHAAVLNVISVIAAFYSVVTMLMALMLVITGLAPTLTPDLLHGVQPINMFQLGTGILMFIIGFFYFVVSMFGLNASYYPERAGAFYVLSIVALVVALGATILTCFAVPGTTAFFAQIFGIVIFGMCVIAGHTARETEDISAEAGNEIALRLISIVNVIFGVLTIAMAIIFWALGVSAAPEENPYLSGVGEANLGGMSVFFGVALCITGLVVLIEGVLGFNASRVPSRVDACYGFGIIAIAVTIIGTIISAAQMVEMDWLPQMTNILTVSAAVFAAWRIREHNRHMLPHHPAEHKAVESTVATGHTLS